MEDIESRHKKELKALDGQKRAAIKKAKSTKGKKAKEALASIEKEYETKLDELLKKHKEELAEVNGTNKNEDVAAVASSAKKTSDENPGTTAEKEEEELQRQRKLEKARRKREQARQKEQEREAAIEQETKMAGPSPRDIEMDRIRARLPKEYEILEIPADGHCLYRAVAAQLEPPPSSSPETETTTDHNDVTSYNAVRCLTADALLEHEDELACFCETDTDFRTYVNKVRNSAEWGGHLELRALNLALHRPIHVYSDHDLLVIGDESSSEEQQSGGVVPIRLSYHKQYYALGEHYNQVVKKKKKPISD